jgi:hypothetical protein
MTPPVLGQVEASIVPSLDESLTVPRERLPTTPPTFAHDVVAVMFPLLVELNTPQTSSLEVVVKDPTMPPTREEVDVTDPENCARDNFVRLLVDVHVIEDPISPKMPPVYIAPITDADD